VASESFLPVSHDGNPIGGLDQYNNPSQPFSWCHFGLRSVTAAGFPVLLDSYFGLSTEVEWEAARGGNA